MAFCYSQGIIGQGRRFRNLAREAEAAGPAPSVDSFPTRKTPDGPSFESMRPLDFYRKLDREARCK